MKALKSLYRISNGMIYTISFVILAILTMTNLRFSTYVMNIKEHISIRDTNLFMPAVFLIGIMVLFYVLFKYSDRIDERKLFLIFTIVYLLAGIYVIVNINSVLRYDALSVHKASVAMHHGNFSTMNKGHYTYRYPHQIGFLIYEYILGFISHDAKLLFGINLAAIFGINYFVYKITKEIFDDQHKVNLTAITLSFLFLPQFFFLTFAYGLIPGFFLLTAGVYNLLAAVRTKEHKYKILSSIFLTMAVLMKKNFIIALAACLCYLLLQYFKENNKNYLKFMVLLIVMFVAGKMVMTTGFEAATGKKVSKGVPSILWVAMGTDPDNHVRSGGWYNRKYIDVYVNKHYDREKAARQGEKMVSGYMEHYRRHPQKAYKFFSRKLITTWTDPLYESVFSGPKAEAGQHVKTKQLHRLFNDEKYDTFLYIGMKAYIIFLLAAVWIFGMRYLKEYDKAALGLIFLIGGFLFHLFWETKGQYVYPYIFMQIPAAAYAVTRFYERISAKSK